jgi:DNA polymerase-3 subunit gamma/tau
LRELSETAKAEADAALRAHPLVAATLAAFPGAELIADEPEPKVASQGQRWRK